MRRLLLTLLVLCLMSSAALAEGALGYRFADAEEAAGLLMGNRAYFENLNQDDLNFRMQRLGVTLPEFEAYAAAQLRDFTEAEKGIIDSSMAFIEDVCRERGYRLPPTDGIVFCKSTMADECDAWGYTHGTQIYLAESALESGLRGDPEAVSAFRELVAHELFHCLTRNHPDFRANMYAIIGFTVAGQDYDLGPAIRERMISNPDVEHHDAWATFDIGGRPVDCVAVFQSGKPFEKPGDSFFMGMVTGLVPVDDLSTLYTAQDASNFWDVFGRNTDYVIDPEETMADNFSFTLVRGLENVKYATVEIIEKIDALLKGKV